MVFVDLRNCMTLVGIFLCCAFVSISSHNGNGKMISLTAEQFVSTYSSHRLSSEFILTLYKNLSKGVPLNQATGRPANWRTVKAADTIRAFQALDVYQMNQQLVYKFNVSKFNKNERLRTVELRLRLPQAWKSKQELHALTIASNNNSLVYASAIPTVASTWDEFTIMDITTTVREWFDLANTKNMNKDLTLDLVFSVVQKRKTPGNKMLRMLYRRDEDKSTHNTSFDAILVTYTKAGDFFLPTELTKNITKEQDIDSPAIFETDDDNVTESQATEAGEFSVEVSSPNRLARHVPINPFGRGRPCHRKDFHVDFLKIGWGEWVVYPTEFNAYQCGGRCGGFADSRSNPSNHAIVQSLMRLGINKAVPISCCTPTKLLPLNILYLEKGEVVIKLHEEMIIKDCACL